MTIFIECPKINSACLDTGINAVNVTGGVSHISVTPLGDCLCGSRDTAFVKPDSAGGLEYLSAGDDKKRTFLAGSLFEKDFGHEDSGVEAKERRRSYDMDWEGHLERVTEEVLLDRTPAFAIDMLYYFDISDDLGSEQLSEMCASATDMEYRSVFKNDSH